jgi:hypothetical protein
MKYTLVLTLFVSVGALAQVQPSFADVASPTVVDSYWVQFHCEVVRAELSQSRSNSAANNSRDSLDDVAAYESKMKTLKTLSDQLESICRTMDVNVAANAPTEQDVTRFTSSLKNISDQVSGSGDETEPQVTTSFAELQPAHPDSTWGNTPEIASNMLHEYFSKVRGGGGTSAAGGAVIVEPKFTYYVTMLIVDSSTTTQDSERMRVAFEHLGKSIGDSRMAIWLGQYSNPDAPDVDHARLWMQLLTRATSYPLTSAGGPYLVFSNRLPDEATSVFVIDLHPYSIDDKISRIDEIADDLSAAKSDNQNLDPNRAYWQDVQLRVREVLTSVFGTFFHH